MTLLSIPLFILTIISIYLGVKMYFINPASWLNRLSCANFLLISLYAILEYSLQLVTDLSKATTLAWLHHQIVAFLLITYFFSTKVYSQQNRAFPKIYVNFFVPLLMVSLSLLIFLQLKDATCFFRPPFLEGGEWRYLFYQSRFSYKLFIFCCFYGIILSIYHLFHGYFHSKNDKEQKLRFNLLIIYMITPLLIFFLFALGVDGESSGRYLISPLLFVCVYSLSIFYSNYQLWQLDPYRAFENILDSIGNQIFILDNDLEIKYINKSANRLTNEVSTVSSFLKTLDLPANTQKQLQKGLHNLSETDQFELNHRIGEHNLLIQFSPIFHKKARLGYAAIASDITQIRQYEEQLEEFTEELQEKNKELERFAYIASHDLKSPIRNVVSFLGLIKRKLQDHEDESVKEFITIASTSAAQLYRLVEDVLEFSKLTKNTKPPFSSLDSGKIIKTALINLDFYVREKNAKIQISEQLPKIIGEQSLLTQLFQNLIENGIKYNLNPQPIIKIEYYEERGLHNFLVTDNGIGIDTRFQDSVFDMFKRLHNSQEYEGTGIGLAICKKIVAQHSGTIQIKSNKGAGSIFHFSLKKDLSYQSSVLK